MVAVLAGAIWWLQRTNTATQQNSREHARDVRVRPDGGEFVDDNAAELSSGGSTPSPGQPLTVKRVWPSAKSYSTLRLADDDDLQLVIATAAARLGEPIRHDQSLDEAAREVAGLTALLGALPPEPALTYLLHSSGAPDGSVSVQLVRSSGHDDGALERLVRDALQEVPEGAGPLRVGIGEAEGTAPTGRVMVVLMARLAVEVDEVPTHGQAGSTIRVEFTPLGGWNDLHALMHVPGAPMQELAVREVGRQRVIELVMPAELSDGETIELGVDGTGPSGPGKLMQLTIWVGDRPAGAMTVHVATADPTDLDIAKAEQYAATLLNDDRVADGGTPLVWDAALASVARAHSVDMRDHQFFGHRSVRTGLAGDRLAAAKYWAQSYGENLAKNDTLGEAEAALWQSLGHRANIIGESFTRVGVGVARDNDGQWYVTQLMARPSPLVNDATARAIFTRINTERTKTGSSTMSYRDELSKVAAAGVTALGDDTVEVVTTQVSAALRSVVRGSAAVWVASGIEPDTFALPSQALASQARELGVAVWQDPSDGSVGVVLIIAN